jgi:hypothetical protein
MLIMINDQDIFCVCFDVMYSGEYNVSDVTLSVYPHRAGWNHGGNRSRYLVDFPALPGVDTHSE